MLSVADISSEFMSYTRGLTDTLTEEEIMYVLVQVTGVATVRIGGVDSIIRLDYY